MTALSLRALSLRTRPLRPLHRRTRTDRPRRRQRRNLVRREFASHLLTPRLLAARALLPLAALALASAPVRAAEAEATARALEEAMAEMRVYFTCSALEPETQQFLRDYWSGMVAATLEHLQAEGIGPANLAAFAASAEPDALLPGPEVTFAEVRAYCATEGDWVARLAAFDLPQLPQALEDLAAPE